MMNEPSIEKLTSNGLNRYQICIATSKVAREIINGYNEEEKSVIYDDKISSKKPVHDDKPVKTAVHAIDAGEYEVIIPNEKLSAEEVGSESITSSEK